MIKTSGFVIKKYDFREYDRIYTVYTEELGKVPIFVRSARKIKSKLAPGLENFNEVRLNFIKGRIFNHLAGWSTTVANSKILRETEKIEATYDCLYLLDRLIKEEEPDKNIFGLLKEVINAINTPFFLPLSKGELEGVLQKIKVYFFWRLVDSLGYRPQLDSCAFCGNLIKEESRELRFNITDNIIICRQCAGDGMAIGEQTLQTLKQIFQFSLNSFLNLELDEQLISITNKSKQIKLSEL